MRGIDTNPNQAGTSTGVKKAWSYLKLLRKESMGIPTLFWNKCVYASDQSKEEALREQYESVIPPMATLMTSTSQHKEQYWKLKPERKDQEATHNARCALGSFEF